LPLLAEGAAVVRVGESRPFLRVEGLKKYFPLGRGFSLAGGSFVRAVDGVSFTLQRGQILGLVGESGCGKTTAGRAVLRLIQPTEGRIFFDGEDFMAARGPELANFRRRMQIVFQDPYSSLDPRMSVLRIVKEPLDNFFRDLTGRQKAERVAGTLEQVGLRPEHMTRFPHEFSGGQRQRIALARALVSEPKLIVCDEPVSALDVSIQAQVINLLKKLQRELDLSLIFISHDLAVVEYICDPIAVMYLGRIVEISPKAALYKKPLHPYTEALLSAVPIPDPVLEKKRRVNLLSGDVPSPLNSPSGCAFHPRCPLRAAACEETRPELLEVMPDHWVACLVRAGERAAEKANPLTPPN
jgi:oligopeptide/dipeptide ABC transporter ATP-binding protein